MKHEYVLTMDQSDAGSAGIFSQLRQLTRDSLWSADTIVETEEESRLLRRGRRQYYTRARALQHTRRWERRPGVGYTTNVALPAHLANAPCTSGHALVKEWS